MKKLPKVLAATLCFTFVTFLVTCQKKAVDLSVKKLELRQKIDGAILRIDEQLGNLEKNSVTIGEEQDETETQIRNLKEMRGGLNQLLSDLAKTTESDWAMFQTKADKELEEVSRALETLKLEQTTQTLYPTTS